MSANNFKSLIKYFPLWGFSPGSIKSALDQTMVQIIGIATVALLSFVGTVIIVKIIQATSGLRVSESQEINEGLDFGSHGESSYNL